MKRYPVKIKASFGPIHTLWVKAESRAAAIAYARKTFPNLKVS